MTRMTLFHVEEHQLVCLGHQFEKDVTCMCVTTPHLLNNIPRSENCGWQKVGHLDGAFNWCKKDFGMIGFGMSSMGAHFNPVSLSIVNSESKSALEFAYDATCAGVHMLYNEVVLCQDPACGFCIQLAEQVNCPLPPPPLSPFPPSSPSPPPCVLTCCSAVKMDCPGGHWRNHLKSKQGKEGHFQLDKPSSDNSTSFHPSAKEMFGQAIPVQQCGQHLTAISFQKKYFDKTENCELFHQHAARLLKAPQ
jgi:hypothetical protein